MLTLILVTLGICVLVFGSFYLLHKELKKENDKTKPIYEELLLKVQNIKTLDEAKELRKNLLDKFFTLTPRWYREKILTLISEVTGVIYYLENKKVYSKETLIELIRKSHEDEHVHPNDLENWIKENIG